MAQWRVDGGEKYPAGRAVMPDVLDCETITVTFIQSLLSQPSINAIDLVYQALWLSEYKEHSSQHLSILLIVVYNCCTHPHISAFNCGCAEDAGNPTDRLKKLINKQQVTKFCILWEGKERKSA